MTTSSPGRGVQRRVAGALVALALLAPLLVTAGPAGADARGNALACPAGVVGEDFLVDAGPEGSAQEAAIDCLLSHGVSAGAAPGAFLPDRIVTRAEMASFVVRTLGVTDDFVAPGGDPDAFSDNPPSVHQQSIADVAELGIAQGFGDDTFRPRQAVTRGQMASFLVGLLEVAGAEVPASPQNAFADDDGTTHEDAIDVIAALEITTGTAGGGYEPAAGVSRRQMAAFLTRTLDLLVDQGLAAPPPAPGLTVEPVVSGLDIPWDVAFTPDGTMVIPERAGTLSVRRPDGTTRDLAADFGDLFAQGEAGLLGLVVDPRFGTDGNRRIYTCQAHTGPNDVRVIAWNLDEGYTTATRVDDPLVSGLPLTSGRHSGCRLSFGSDGELWIGTGDAATGTNPQDLDSLGGKVLRVDPDTGAPSPGNPLFTAENPTSRLIYTVGHRNVQGLALRGDGTMWSVEHGPARDDEVNLLSPLGNYGWDPVPGYNERVPMTDRQKYPTAVPAAWSSGPTTIATSGAAFLEGLQWRSRQGALAVAALAGQELRLLRFGPDGVLLAQETVPELDGDFGRLRAVTLGPDGALYVTTSNGGGQDSVLRVTPH